MNSSVIMRCLYYFQALVDVTAEDFEGREQVGFFKKYFTSVMMSEYCALYLS